jgi:hypothetical protein
MHDTKPWYTSVTIWGAIVSVLASVLSLFKVRLDPQLQADLRDWLLAGATLAGGAAALWGRLRASRRILSPATAETRPQDWRMNAVLFPFAPILLLLLLSQSTGCSALQPPTPDYVAADRATYEAVAPQYSAYVHADAALDEEGKARRDRTIATWDARLRAAGGGKSEIRSSKSETNPKDQSGNDQNADGPSEF